jgi:hypothetical protein
MRRMRRFAASLRLSAVLAGPAVLGLAALVSVTSAVLTTGTAPALAASGGSATLAASGNPPGDTVASVVPSTATAGSRVTFAVSCASLDATSATLFGHTLGLPEQIPMEAGSADGDFVITVTLPSGIAPGTYRPDIDCSDGTSTTATLTVSTMPAGGGAQTGDGTTSTTTNTGLATGGLVLIGIGAVAGGIALRRRAAGRSSGIES